MRKLSDYVKIAAEEYWQETGNNELESRWISEFFQDCGVLDDHPQQDLVGFYSLVQKVLTKNFEQAEKLARLR
jgi:hypothetical protein